MHTAVDSATDLVNDVAQNTADCKADTSRRQKWPTRADEEQLFDADANEEQVLSYLYQRAASSMRYTGQKTPSAFDKSFQTVPPLATIWRWRWWR